MTRYSVSNLTHTGQQIWKVQVEIHLYHLVKYGCHGANVHETHACFSVELYTDFMKVQLLILCHRHTAGWLHGHGYHIRHSFFFHLNKRLKLVANLVREPLVYSQLIQVAFIWVCSQLLPKA
jgi:hypothetical protein